MVSNHGQLLYSAAATARILQIATQRVKAVREFWNAVWVWVQGKRPTFMSKRAYRLEFVEFRKRAARLLNVLSQRSSHFGTLFEVESSRPGESYFVEVSPSGIACSCEDFHNQTERLGKACCKHCYAVLFKLGYDSLATWQEHADRHTQVASRPRATQYKGVSID